MLFVRRSSVVLVALAMLVSGCGMKFKAYHVSDIELSFEPACGCPPLTPDLGPRDANPNREAK